MFFCLCPFRAFSWRNKRRILIAARNAGGLVGKEGDIAGWAWGALDDEEVFVCCPQVPNPPGPVAQG